MMNAVNAKRTLHALAIFFLPPFTVIPLASAGNQERGAEIYNVNCVACHGPSGQPDPDSALVKSLGVMPAVFSDALFNSREPA